MHRWYNTESDCELSQNSRLSTWYKYDVMTANEPEIPHAVHKISRSTRSSGTDTAGSNRLQQHWPVTLWLLGWFGTNTNAPNQLKINIASKLPKLQCHHHQWHQSRGGDGACHNRNTRAKNVKCPFALDSSNVLFPTHPLLSGMPYHYPSIPLSVRDAPSVSTFKCRLTSFYFNPFAALMTSVACHWQLEPQAPSWRAVLVIIPLTQCKAGRFRHICSIGGVAPNVT